MVVLFSVQETYQDQCSEPRNDKNSAEFSTITNLQSGVVMGLPSSKSSEGTVCPRMQGCKEQEFIVIEVTIPHIRKPQSM